MAAAVEEEWESAVGSLSVDPPKEDPTGGKCVCPSAVNGNSGSLSDRTSSNISLDANGATPAVTAVSETKGAPSSAVSSASKADSVKPSAAQDEQIDPSLLEALENAREYVLKLEEEVVAFVTAEEPKPHLVLPPRSQYQRLIACRLCARFKLQKASPAQEKEALVASGFPASVGSAFTAKIASGNGATSHLLGKEQRATVFFRVADTGLPAVLLSTLHAEAQKKEASAAAAAAVLAATAAAAASNKGAPIKLMRRIPGDPRAKASQQGSGGGALEKQVKSVEDREREYAEARARIFGTRSPTGPPTPPQSGSGGGGISSVTPAAAGNACSAVAPSPGSSLPASVSAGTSVDSPRGIGAIRSVAAGEATSEVGLPGGAADSKDGALVNGNNEASAGVEGSNGAARNSKTSSDGNGVGGVGGVGGAGGEEQGKGATGAGAGGKEVSPSGSTAGSASTPGRKTEREGKQVGGATTSLGPDGTPGFGRGRGKPLSTKEEGERVVAGGTRLQERESADKGNGSTDQGRTSGQGSRGSGGSTPGGRGNGGRGNRRPAVNAGEWKGQRGMQRNRVAEMSDPDFVRNYENYRPSFAPYRQLAEPSGFGLGQGQQQQQQQQQRLLHQHQAVGAAGQHGSTHPLLPGMPGHAPGQMPGQGPQGIMVMQPQWQQHMEAQAMAAAAAAAAVAAGAPAYPGGPPPPALYNPGFLDPAQAAAAAAAAGAGGMGLTSAGVPPVPRLPGVPGVPGAVMHHQHMQQQSPHQTPPQHQQQQQQQPQPQPHQQQPQPQKQQQQPQQQQQQPQPQAPQHGHHHGQQVAFAPQQASQQQSQQQSGAIPGIPTTQGQQQPTAMLHQPPPPPQQQQQHLAGGMGPGGGYMTAQDYYGAQHAMFYSDPNMSGMALGYGGQQQQSPQPGQQQPYGMTLPPHAQPQQHQQQQRHHQQGQQTHHPYQHQQLYSIGGMQQPQPQPQPHRRMQGGGSNGSGGRHTGGRAASVPLMSMHSQQGALGGRTVPNRGYQVDFPPLG